MEPLPAHAGSGLAEEPRAMVESSLATFLMMDLATRPVSPMQFLSRTRYPDLARLASPEERTACVIDGLASAKPTRVGRTFLGE